MKPSNLQINPEDFLDTKQIEDLQKMIESFQKKLVTITPSNIDINKLKLLLNSADSFRSKAHRIVKTYQDDLSNQVTIEDVTPKQAIENPQQLHTPIDDLTSISENNHPLSDYPIPSDKALSDKSNSPTHSTHSAPKVSLLFANKACYVCSHPTSKFHSFYAYMCKTCGDFNLSKRDVPCDLTGKIALVTGGRIKIGFETAIRLLRNNATVIVTSRFANDTLDRFQKKSDYEVWKDNLHIIQANFLDLNCVAKIVEYIKDHFNKLDILINNAAQTLARPQEFYKQELNKSIDDTDNKIKMVANSTDFTVRALQGYQLMLKDEVEKNKKVDELFPPNKVDTYGQQIDNRTTNSWILEQDQVDIQEVVQVQIINSIVPFELIKQLKPLMARGENDFSYIINVSSMEGCFNTKKTTQHVHTNMAKASLNMMTRTSGQYYFKSNIVMVSVDTGWNNIMQPVSYNIQSPLDVVDGAARILDPIYRQLKKPGIFYKNYQPFNW